MAGPGDPAAATVATWLDPGQASGDHGAVTQALLGAVGSVRILGSGSVDLALVASGHLHATFQLDPLPWDWLPGALVVAEAGGAVVSRGPWRFAGVPALVERLAALA